METIQQELENAKEVNLKAPKLDAIERLYVRAYLHSLSHIKAHRAVDPELKTHSNTNKYSERSNVQFHINLALQERAESLSLTPEVILDRLFHEATSYGQGTNQNARIMALQILGKHLGMFQEKKEEHSSAPIFNIVNYNQGIPHLEMKDNVPELKIEQVVKSIDDQDL